MLSSSTASDAAGNTKCVLCQPTDAARAALALAELVEVASDDVEVMEELDVDGRVELETVELEEAELVAVELVELTVDEEEIVLIEVNENEMSVPSVAAASVVLEPEDDVVDRADELDELLENDDELCAVTVWVESIAMQTKTMPTAIFKVGSCSIRTIFACCVYRACRACSRCRYEGKLQSGFLFALICSGKRARRRR